MNGVVPWLFAPPATPLWTIYVGQLMIAFMGVVCLVLILRRLNDHLAKTIEIAVGLIVKQQELTKLLVDTQDAHVQQEVKQTALVLRKLETLIQKVTPP